MVVRPQPQEVKQLVVRTFLDLGATSRSLFSLHETLLVQGKHCMARAYRAEDYRALWSIDDGTVKFYDAAGCLLRVVNLLQQRTARLMAA
jgi:hypothetical protein